MLVNDDPFSESVGVETRLAYVREWMVGRKYRLGNLETPWEWGLGKDNEGGKWTDEERQLQGEAE